MKNSQKTNTRVTGMSMLIVAGVVALSLQSNAAIAGDKDKPAKKIKPPISEPKGSVCRLLPQLCRF